MNEINFIFIYILCIYTYIYIYTIKILENFFLNLILLKEQKI